MKLPFLLASVLEVAADKASIVVQWWVPGASPMVRYGGGKKQNKIDVVSAWTPSSYMQLGDMADSVLPDIIVDIADVLQINVEIGPDHLLPFPVLDQLRYDDVIGLTALSYSQTQLGTVYRSHALMTAKPTPCVENIIQYERSGSFRTARRSLVLCASVARADDRQPDTALKKHIIQNERSGIASST